MSTDSQLTEQLCEKIDTGARKLSLELTEQQCQSLVQFLRLLDKWNRVYNLTAVRDIHDMVGRHILDSLTVLQSLPSVSKRNESSQSHTSPLQDSQSNNLSASASASASVVLDVGSGGGLPVLPLAIIRSDLNFVSVESNGKKTRFQQQAMLELGLDNVQVKQERIESVTDRVGVVVSRAFTAPEKFLHAIEKNCLTGASVIIMLGQKERMPNTLPAGFSLVNIREVDVPQCDSIRHIAVCVKE